MHVMGKETLVIATCPPVNIINNRTVPSIGRLDKLNPGGSVAGHQRLCYQIIANARGALMSR